ncbi:putative 7-carboxy-7-deazaguanine synthase QueE [Helicovermis profundi]|uniref:7-carboxy-7-deazaguanine synthase n=1 Tax=Helicovermis profundi TaxID=3065157 RepID=A0AAU9E2P1_9FIRM|nr:putative 7-carboxy-7-deazaguanine synthase QueE [Clostridia bacterium S502]
MYKIVEKFVSINGEGKKGGELAVFIRFKGCNLNCSYCDTKWANKDDAVFESMTKEEIYDYIKKTNVKNVTLTGGEPLIQENILKLIDFLLKDELIELEIETNGSVDISLFRENISSKRLSFTIDYKSISSGMNKYMFLDNLKYVRNNDTVKFVCGSDEDLLDMYFVIKKYKLDLTTSVYISSVFGEIKPKRIVEFMIDKNLNNVRFQIQMHKIIWQPDMIGV